MSLSYEITPLKDKDVEESAKFLQNLGNHVPQIFSAPKLLEQSLRGPHAITLVAKGNGEIVGMIHATATYAPNILLLATKPGWGLGSTLVDKFVDYVRSELPSAKAVRTSLAADMTEIVAFYSSKGFVVDGFVKGAIQGRDLVSLQKRLSR